MKKKIILEIIFYFFPTFTENCSRRVCKSTYKTILALVYNAISAQMNITFYKLVLISQCISERNNASDISISLAW